MVKSKLSKQERIIFRVKTEDKNKFAKKAEKKGFTLSEWIRRLLETN